MAKILLKVGEKLLREILLEKGEVKIGRDPSNDIHLDNPAVSRFHAKIRKENGPHYLEDLKSTNGTFLNGKRVTWKDVLNNRDSITIGKHTLVFVEQVTDYEDKKNKMIVPGADATMMIRKKEK